VAQNGLFIWQKVKAHVLKTCCTVQTQTHKHRKEKVKIERGCSLNFEGQKLLLFQKK